jgi:hypothetical protein
MPEPHHEKTKDEVPTHEQMQKRAAEFGQGPIANLTPRGLAAHCIAEEKQRKGWQNPARLSSYEGICEGFAEARKAEEKDREKREHEREKREEAHRKEQPQPVTR